RGHFAELRLLGGRHNCTTGPARAIQQALRTAQHFNPIDVEVARRGWNGYRPSEAKSIAAHRAGPEAADAELRHVHAIAGLVRDAAKRRRRPLRASPGT